MAYAMTKQGSLDNCITYEFICDTLEDMNAIENRYRTIGSVAVVLQGESGGMEAYIAGSDKQWNNLGAMGASGSGSESAGGGLSIYICAQNEVSNGLPNIASPDETTIYLVSAGNESGNLYEEYIYVNSAWEKFGAGSIDLSSYATKANPEFTGTIKINGGVTPGTNAIALGYGSVAQAQNSIAILGGNVAQAATGAIAIQNATAAGANALAIGGGCTAEGNFSFAHGTGNYTKGQGSHAEGQSTSARGTGSHSEGNSTEANGNFSHAEGTSTRAAGTYSHVSGMYNVEDSYNNLDEWVANTSYTVGDKVRVTTISNNTQTVQGYICKTANNDSTFTASKWTSLYGRMNYAEIVGNGTANGARSNARALDWDGNEYLKGDLYIGCSANSTGGNKVASTVDTVLTTTLSRGRKANTTVGVGSFAFGDNVTASGAASHAEGNNTTASNVEAHAEGLSTIASGIASHAEGDSTTASSQGAHAEGYLTTASAQFSHAEGYGGTYTSNNVTYTSGAVGMSDHTEGYQCLTANGQPGNHAEGYQTRATGGAAHSEGANTVAQGNASHAEGISTIATGQSAHTEGYMTNATGQYSHAEGTVTLASGAFSHAEGAGTNATQSGAHAEGQGTTASGENSHVEGGGTTASGVNSHAEGASTVASGVHSHAEGASTVASGAQSHAEGASTVASGAHSHAEGCDTIASGTDSHVGGAYNIADSYDNWDEWVANTSYAVGNKVKVTTTNNNITTVTGYICKTANSDSTFISSKWTNQDGKMNFVEIIGNGNDSNHSNARALDWDGNEYLKGDLYIGCAADSTGGTKLARIPDPPITDGTYTLQATVASGVITYTWVTGA